MGVALSLPPGDRMAPVAAWSRYLMRCADVGALGAISVAPVEGHGCGRAAPHGGVAIPYAPVVADAAVERAMRVCCAGKAARRNRQPENNRSCCRRRNLAHQVTPYEKGQRCLPVGRLRSPARLRRAAGGHELVLTLRRLPVVSVPHCPHQHRKSQHCGPTGGLDARVGMQGSMKPGGCRLRPEERHNMTRKWQATGPWARAEPRPALTVQLISHLCFRPPAAST